MPELLIDYDKQAKAEIKESLDKVARGTQRVAMEASLAAAEEMLAAIKAAAPSDSGTLRAGLVLHAEKNRKRGSFAAGVVPRFYVKILYSAIGSDSARCTLPAGRDSSYRYRFRQNKP